MEIPGWLTLNLYVMLIAVMLLIFTLHKKQKIRQDRTFTILLVTVLILLCGDFMSRCDPDGEEGALYVISRIGNYIIFAGDPVGYLTTLLYIDSWINEPDKKSTRAVTVLVTAYTLINFLLVTLNEITGIPIFYSFPNHIYTRGPYFVLRGVINMIFCLVIGMYILLRRKEIPADYQKYVIAFPIIVLFSGMLQVFVGGASYEYAGTIFACLLLYIYVQNHNMDADYLTGALNRKGIDEELKYRIHHYNQRFPFCAYMLDLDYFKNINDNCGHETGDEALRMMAGFLRKSFGKNAVIGRYGGDEFLVISDSSDLSESEKCVKRLNELCDKFNTEENHSYRLGFSIGYDQYDASLYKTADDYIRHIDRLMYKQKKSHHAVRI